jgi:type I restriction enzyme S subunit
MKKYDKYKDSGVEWIGEIPFNWSVGSLKLFCTNITDGSHHSPPTVEDGKRYISVKDIGQNEILFQGCKQISEEEFQLLEKNGCRPLKGDILLTKDGTIGRAAIVGEDNDFVALSSLGIIRPNTQKIDPIFLREFLVSHLNINQMLSLIQGSALTRITISIIKNLLVTVPPLKEQIQIASFLHKKTQDIDTLIAKKEQLIKLLEEERTSMINLAVTKGLDLNVPMKDSGIEWLGEIPEHWELNRISFLSSKVGDGLHGTPNYVDESKYAFINGSNIQEGQIVITEKTRYVSKQEYLNNKKEFTSNTILMSINGTIGNLTLYNSEAIMLGKSAAYINLLPHINKHFIYFYYKSQTALEYINRELSGSTIKNLSLYSISKTPVPCPSAAEMEKIVSYIKSESVRINSIISKTKQETDFLKEYKTTLKSEVVTGKVDVREAVLAEME